MSCTLQSITIQVLLEENYLIQDTMEDFDDRIMDRLFDNFQFVNFHEVTTNSRNPQASFALHALMEIPGIYYFKFCIPKSIMFLT